MTTVAPPRVRYRYRERFFAEHGWGPYACFFCTEDVMFEDVVVHHVDNDRSNDAVENLAAAHRGCHSSHHIGCANDVFTPVHRARLSAAASRVHQARSPEEHTAWRKSVSDGIRRKRDS